MDNPTSSSDAGPSDAKKLFQLSPGDEAEITSSPQLKDESMETAEECSVCRNEMIDTTKLSGCVHEFCYDCIVGWLTKGAGQFCPMCKAPVKYIKRKGTDEEITLEQLKTETEPAPTASADLVTEKRIVSRKIRSCRRLMNQIDEIIGSTADRSDSRKREIRTGDLNSMKQQCVAQLNSLQMLREDIDHGAAKALIVSRVEFRRLIYERLVVAGGIPEVYVLVSKDEFLKNIEHYRAVLHSFLNVELKALPAAKQPKLDKENTWFFNTLPDVAPGQHEEFVNRIFSLISDTGISNVTKDQIIQCLNYLISNRCAALLISELRSLINSKKSFLDWCGSVTYRIRTDRGGESGQNDVVTVDDDGSDDELIETEPIRIHRLGPIFNPVDQIFGPTSSRYNNHRSSSDSDQDDDFYFQRPLRIPTTVNQYRAPPHPLFPPIPPAGINWNDLTRTTETRNKYSDGRKRDRRKKRQNGSDGIPVVCLGDDNEVKRRVSDCENSSDSEIQVVNVNGTIVLDDSIDTRAEKDSIDKNRKRRTEDLTDFNWKRTKSSSLPVGIVDDVQKLIVKYGLSLTDALSTIGDATRDAIVELTKLEATPKPETLLERLTACISNSAPERDLFASSSDMARTGMLLPPKDVPSTSSFGYQ